MWLQLPRLGVGVLAVRKSGKLPVFSEVYVMEYGSGTIEVPVDSVELRGRNVIDDVLATDGTLDAVC